MCPTADSWRASIRGEKLSRRLLPLVAMGVARPALAQEFPNRPVRMIVAYGAGNAADVAGRAVAEALSKIWPQRVVVENIPGAGGALGVAAAARAQPDGHTLVLAALPALTITPHLLRGQIGYDPLTDFVPIGLVASTRSALVVNATLPVHDVPGLAAHARSAGPLFYYSAGTGTLPHLNMEILKAALNVPLEHIPYRNATSGLADLLAGRLQLCMDAASVTLAAILDGRLRPLFWNGPSRNPLLPKLPTAAEVLPDQEFLNSWIGLMAPRGVPAAVLAQLEAGLAAVLDSAGLAERMGDGLQVTGGGAVAFAHQLRRDYERFAVLLPRLNL